MGTDAIALIRPSTPSAVRGVFDPEIDSIEVLDDGALLWSTFVRFRMIQEDADEGRALLTPYGSALIDAHQDPRGILFFPDVIETRGRTYDEVVSSVGEAGVWVPAQVLTEAELSQRQARLLADVDAIQRAVATGPAAIEALELDGTEPSLEEQVDKMASTLQASSAVLERFARSFAEGCVGCLLQFPAGRSTPAAELDDATLSAKRRLGDGTIALLTTRVDDEMIALQLAEELKPYTSEHRDPRGVPTFRARDLEELTNLTGYEETLTYLGDRVTFVQPTSHDQLEAARKAKLREYLDSDD